MTDLRALHQAAYDYVWDRWGVYIGTVRITMIVLAFAESLIPGAYKIVTGTDDNPIATLVGEAAVFAMIWFFYGRDHLGTEWQWQHNGNFQALNAKALEWQSSGLYSRIAFGLIVAGGWMAFKNDAVAMFAKGLALLSFFSWSYLCEAVVRERDPDRFAVGKLASQNI